MQTVTSPQRLPDFLLSRGQHTLTAPEAAEMLDGTLAATRRALSRLLDDRQIFSAGRGLYVVVPPEYRSWGVVPAAHFIDDLMRVRGRQYYVGLLSAAEMHGAAHQAPQVFQVLVDRPIADRDLGRVRLRFHVGAHVAEHPDEGVVTRNVPTGTIRVSGPELTAVDLVDYADAAGGLNNVATVLSELQPLDGQTLADLAARRERAVTRRLGWLLEQFGPEEVDLEPLREIAQPGAGDPSVLRTGAPNRGSVARDWGVRVNTAVEPDDL